jgi:hypothetical protein
VPLLFSPEVPTPTYLQEQVLSQGACHKQDLKELIKSDGMVERFNRTLETMLSAYVSDNHKDWDRQLPYVMMAYRATAHETTGFSPNMLMLGRETSTPLDLVYDMPPGIKPVPANMWVWELRERIEEAHALVRKYSEGSILFAPKSLFNFSF